jgi:hypothetical protein
MRKASEAPQTRQRMQTPGEFSNYKHERERKMHEKQELYRQQVLAQQRVLIHEPLIRFHGVDLR